MDADLTTTYKGLVRPISKAWVSGALAVSHISREEHEAYQNPEDVMGDFLIWLKQNSVGKPIFMSDNPAFDWQFINYYCHAFTGGNPFGFSARRIGDFYSGLRKDIRASSQWKKLRKTKHTHDPVDDAKGNAEALIAMCLQYKVTL